MEENDEQERRAEQALRRLAMQLSLQLPVDHDEAARVIGFLVDITDWRAGKPSGREERMRRFRLISGVG